MEVQVLLIFKEKNVLVNIRSIWYTAVILLPVLTGCTIVNTEGSIKKVNYKIIKQGNYQSNEVEVEASNCPIVETELEVKEETSRLISYCKTILK